MVKFNIGDDVQIKNVSYNTLYTDKRNNHGRYPLSNLGKVIDIEEEAYLIEIYNSEPYSHNGDVIRLFYHSDKLIFIKSNIHEVW